MKRLFTTGLGPRRKGSEEDDQVNNANTLDRLLKDKEGVRRRLEEEEKEYISRRKECVTNLIKLEQQEVARREKELSEKKKSLEEKRRLNQQVRDKYVEQMKLLELKFAEVTEEHSRVEEELDTEIKGLEDKLEEVMSSLNDKLSEFGPSAPEADQGIYPDLADVTRSLSLTGEDRLGSSRHSHGSTGSSPQISISSTISAHSTTGKGENEV
eukprot:TRINITY_DN8095_c0_g1_i1.p1 TRINITY_DN8095_c0_g1~~TRINITY_DN8095_c0_g1_i1.p1  ORF type:complete len:212 (-),score=62.55 TRINITY_DN8095_c0_g1_i1:440-1075(-)